MRARKIYFLVIIADYLIPLTLTARQNYYEKQIVFNGSNSISLIFPASMHRPTQVSDNTAAPTQSDQKCPIEAGWIYYKGVCSQLLTNLACETTQWLVINREGAPHCENRPCPFEELSYGGKCVTIANDAVCGDSEVLFVEFTGEVYCDCIPGFIYDHPISKCIAEHRQGSCPPGMVLELQGNQINCIDNKCSADDQIYNSKDGRCYEKTFEGACSEKEAALIFEEAKNTASCASLSNKNIFEFPSIGCKKGTKRIYNQQCKKIFQLRKTSVSRVSSASSLLTSKCPPFFRQLPNGICTRN